MSNLSKLLILVILLPGAVMAQKHFEGTIKYNIEYLVIPEDMQDVSDILPKEMAVSVAGSKSRMAQTAAQGQAQIVISDLDNHQAVVLMNFMGRKIALKSDMSSEIPSKEEGSLSYNKNKATISGFKCKGATYDSGQTDMPTEIFYYPKFANYSDNFGKLSGLPLQYTIYSGGFKVRYVAVSVEQLAVSDDEFAIPSEYEIMTQEEFEQSIMNLN